MPRYPLQASDPTVIFTAAMSAFDGRLIHPECADPDEHRGRLAGDVGARCPRCGFLLLIPPDQMGHDLGLHPVASSPTGEEVIAKIAASSPGDHPPAWAKGRNVW